MKKFTFALKISAYLLLCGIFLSFSASGSIEEDWTYIHRVITDHYDFATGPKNLKKYEIFVTSMGFCRYKRIYNSGKVEYFAFNLTKYKSIDYHGDTRSGILILRTRGDDVIVQTYHDSKGGDIDSMATYMAIPLRDVEAEDLIGLSEKLQQMSQKLRQ